MAEKEEEKRKPEYEKPELKELETAHGACVSGSGQVGEFCSNGGFADFCSQGAGYAAQ